MEIRFEDDAEPLSTEVKEHPEMFAHRTNGRDHAGVEWTLCGLKVTWTSQEHNAAAKAGKWCQRCADLDG